MGVDKVNKGSKNTTSPIRTSRRNRNARYKPATREPAVGTKPQKYQRNLNQTWPTSSPAHHRGGQKVIGTRHSQPCPPHLLQEDVAQSGGTHHMNLSTSQNNSLLRLYKNEKSVLDKVEDMDVDNQSDQEGISLGETITRISGSSSFYIPEVNKEKSIQTNRRCESGGVQEQEPKKNNKNTQSPGEKRKRSYETPSKHRPVYVILHVSRLKIGFLDGRALKPVRIQAGQILIEMEVQSNDKQENEVIKLRLPCKQLLAIKVNLSEPPFIFVAVINENYSKTLIKGCKSRMLNQVKEMDNLHVIAHLRYDIISDDLRKDLTSFRTELSADALWDEISCIQARRILNGEESIGDVIKSRREERKDVCLVDDETKPIKERMKRQSNVATTSHKQEVKCNEEAMKNETDIPSKVQVEKKDVFWSSEDNDNLLNHKERKSLRRSSPPAKRPRNQTLESSGTKDKEQTSAPDQKTEEAFLADRPANTHRPEVTSANGSSESVNGLSHEKQSFEENRLDAIRVVALQRRVAEKEKLLSHQRRLVELCSLQLQQERDCVRNLRASLRDEQRRKLELQQRYEAVNNEMLVRNARKATEESRVRDLEEELSELNLSLNNTKSENQRLVDEIHQAREQLSEKEENLRSEQDMVTVLQQEIESTRTTLETLNEDLRQKTLTLSQEGQLRTAADERNAELEQRLIATRNEYEDRIVRDNDEHQRTRREHEECSRMLTNTREQLQDANRALHRAQQTVEEYARMQPRDWTISRDEIIITEKVLGQGAWGWVKEGKFRGTVVAVKQMHELIVSPHNRRLFEREMQIAAQCRHPNLMQFIGATNDNGLALLVTELLDINLRTLLGQRSLSNDEVVTIATDVSKALNYLHLNKPFAIVHRDISSTNVLLCKREDTYRAKLSDYGAANFMRQCMTISPGASIYAAPEAATSRQSTKVDVYSFGRLLCEMCIRELPVPRDTHEQIRSITNPYLRELVQRCTREIPENRPTMAEVLTTLERIQ